MSAKRTNLSLGYLLKYRVFKVKLKIHTQDNSKGSSYHKVIT